MLVGRVSTTAHMGLSFIFSYYTSILFCVFQCGRWSDGYLYSFRKHDAPDTAEAQRQCVWFPHAYPAAKKLPRTDRGRWRVVARNHVFHMVTKSAGFNRGVQLSHCRTSMRQGLQNVRQADNSKHCLTWNFSQILTN